MKTFTPRFPLSPEKAAAIAAFSCLSLTAFAAPQPGPVAVVPPTTTGAHSGSPAPAITADAPAGPDEDILDIRGPIHIPSAFPWMTWSSGALAAAGVGFAAWALLRRPRRKLPYEIALEELAATRPLMEAENARPFALAVSEIVRLFIERCFPVRAAHRTTSEFLHDLVNLPDSPLAAHREALAQFLEHCDLAKFARWSLTVPQMEAMLESASAFVIAIGSGAAAPAATKWSRRPRLHAASDHAAEAAAQHPGGRGACPTSEGHTANTP